MREQRYLIIEGINFKYLNGEEKEYFLGFDMETGSAGWAVMDTDYNLIKINRKYAWSSKMFDTSEGAKNRRINRCNRRCLDRRQERLELLRELFEEEIFIVFDMAFLHIQRGAGFLIITTGLDKYIAEK